MGSGKRCCDCLRMSQSSTKRKENENEKERRKEKHESEGEGVHPWVRSAKIRVNSIYVLAIGDWRLANDGKEPRRDGKIVWHPMTWDIYPLFPPPRSACLRQMSIMGISDTSSGRPDYHSLRFWFDGAWRMDLGLDISNRDVNMIRASKYIQYIQTCARGGIQIVPNCAPQSSGWASPSWGRASDGESEWSKIERNELKMTGSNRSDRMSRRRRRVGPLVGQRNKHCLRLKPTGGEREAPTIRDFKLIWRLSLADVFVQYMGIAASKSNFICLLFIFSRRHVKTKQDIFWSFFRFIAWRSLNAICLLFINHFPSVYFLL